MSRPQRVLRTQPISQSLPSNDTMDQSNQQSTRLNQINNNSMLSTINTTTTQSRQTSLQRPAPLTTQQNPRNLPKPVQNQSTLMTNPSLHSTTTTNLTQNQQLSSSRRILPNQLHSSTSTTTKSSQLPTKSTTAMNQFQTTHPSHPSSQLYIQQQVDLSNMVSKSEYDDVLIELNNLKQSYALLQESYTSQAHKITSLELELIETQKREQELIQIQQEIEEEQNNMRLNIIEELLTILESNGIDRVKLEPVLHFQQPTYLSNETQSKLDEIKERYEQLINSIQYTTIDTITNPSYQKLQEQLDLLIVQAGGGTRDEWQRKFDTRLNTITNLSLQNEFIDDELKQFDIDITNEILDKYQIGCGVLYNELQQLGLIDNGNEENNNGNMNDNDENQHELTPLQIHQQFINNTNNMNEDEENNQQREQLLPINITMNEIPPVHLYPTQLNELCQYINQLEDEFQQIDLSIFDIDTELLLSQPISPDDTDQLSSTQELSTMKSQSPSQSTLRSPSKTTPKQTPQFTPTFQPSPTPKTTPKTTPKLTPTLNPSSQHQSPQSNFSLHSTTNHSPSQRVNDPTSSTTPQYTSPSQRHQQLIDQQHQYQQLLSQQKQRQQQLIEQQQQRFKQQEQEQQPQQKFQQQHQSPLRTDSNHISNIQLHSPSTSIPPFSTSPQPTHHHQRRSISLSKLHKQSPNQLQQTSPAQLNTQSPLSTTPTTRTPPITRTTTSTTPTTQTPNSFKMNHLSPPQRVPPYDLSHPRFELDNDHDDDQ